MQDAFVHSTQKWQTRGCLGSLICQHAQFLGSAKHAAINILTIILHIAFQRHRANRNRKPTSFLRPSLHGENCCRRVMLFNCGVIMCNGTIAHSNAPSRPYLMQVQLHQERWDQEQPVKALWAVTIRLPSVVIYVFVNPFNLTLICRDSDVKSFDAICLLSKPNFAKSYSQN